MTLIHGKQTFISIGGTDLSAYVRKSNLARTTDTHDVTTYGNDSHVYAPGLNDGKASMSGMYDSTASTGPRATLVADIAANVAVELIRQPEGTGSGLPEDTVDVIVTSYDEEADSTGMVMWTCEMQLSGDIDTTAQAA
jgi:hypothetical protein